jgi:tight adherence protein B
MTLLAAVPVLTGTAGRIVAGGFVFGAVALALYAIANFVVPHGPSMASMISPYAPRDDEATNEPYRMQLAETPLLRRAVEATAKLASGRGLLGRIEHLLTEADAPLKAAEAFFFANAAALIASVLAWVTFRSFALAVLTLVGALILPPVVLKLRIVRRRRKFLAQLPDTLNLLAGSLRAGYSLLQAVETVTIEIRDPMGKELGIVLTETRLGRPLEDALEDAGRRMGSADFDWAVMAINIQREVGGNLAELLSTVAETMVARNRLRREVKALTAEGRVTAVILGALPLVIGAALYVLNPTYMQVMFDRSIGKIVLAGSTVWAIVGFFWMKKIITVNA